MKEIFIMLAKMMDKQQCINKIQESLDEYKEGMLLGSNMEALEQSLTMSCHLYLLNQTEGSAESLIKEMDQVDKSVNFFKTTCN
jgi:hypothetical protein